MADEEFFAAGEDPILRRPVSGRRTPSSILDDPEIHQRYLAAARQWARLKHPNILAVYDVQPEMMLTERVSGQSLHEYLNLPGERRAFSPQLQTMFLPALLQGLGYAHEHGLVHGLLSPKYIYLFPDGSLRLWGFGIAFLEASAGMNWTTRRQAECYFSPEQARGEKIDRRSDIWSLGVLLYFMSTGRLPFVASDLPDLIEQILHRDPPPAPEWSQGSVSRALRETILRCLSKSPAERYQSISDLSAELFPVPEYWIPAAQEALIHHALAETYFHQGKFALARLEWEKAIRVDPQVGAYVNNLAIACWRAGDIPRAEELLEANGNPFNLGLLRMEQADYWGASQCFRQAILLDPKCAASYLLLGECLLAEGKLGEAIEEFQKSLILHPNSSRSLSGLAEAYRRAGNTEESQAYARTAQEFEGSNLVVEPLLQSPPGRLNLGSG